MKKIIYTLMLIGLASCSNKVENQTYELIVVGEGIEFPMRILAKPNASISTLSLNAKLLLEANGYSKKELSNLKVKLNKLN